ncbi:hypothetical protein [Actinomycetospora sp. TBRC 11914]|uniref:hypothetical protein n=1 Tax=Actinomycetospora sp. TBRC 11914 TaxID=2729387 RepID=UPI00145FB01C|nr:hypothetical protein [Actinomycetospora sp. TBRC 11914]NMO93881.1 hypothetical protein [Actinomycetospora sp. TBRC 11914]
MDAARITRLGGWALIVLSVAVGVSAAVLFQEGKAGTPRGSDRVPGYTPAKVVVYVPDDADVSVQLSFRRADDLSGDESVTVARQGRASITKPFLALIELHGAAQLTTPNSASDLYLRPHMVQLPPVRSPLRFGGDAVGARQMYLAEFGPTPNLFGAQVAGAAQVAALQTETSRGAFSSGEIVLEKCRGLPRSLAEVRTTSGFDVARLGRLADFYGGPGSCSPDQSSYRGVDLGRVEVRDSAATAGAIRVDYSMPETRKTAPRDFSPTLEWSWVPQWSPSGTFEAQANFVDINREAQGQSYLFVSGALIGVASSTLPTGIGLLVGPWLARRGEGGRPAGPPLRRAEPSRRRFNSR